MAMRMRKGGFQYPYPSHPSPISHLPSPISHLPSQPISFPLHQCIPLRSSTPSSLVSKIDIRSRKSEVAYYKRGVRTGRSSFIHSYMPKVVEKMGGWAMHIS